MKKIILFLGGFLRIVYKRIVYTFLPKGEIEVINTSITSITKKYAFSSYIYIMKY